jgi:hypothetical protein
MTESDEVDGEIDRHALALDEAALLQAAVKSTQTICEHVSEVCSQFDPTRRSGSMRFSASVRRFF